LLELTDQFKRTMAVGLLPGAPQLGVKLILTVSVDADIFGKRNAQTLRQRKASFGARDVS
jgi:hypothetical protein